ncbi:MAG: PAS domain S-box protein [Chromatiaceae bacterium]
MNDRYAAEDISEPKRPGPAQALAEANQRLAAHLDNSPLAVVEFDREFRIVRWSEAAGRLFGWTATEVLGLAVAELPWVHEEDVEGTRRLMADMLAGQRPRNQHVNRNYRKDGTILHCEWYNSAIYDGQGRLSSILAQALDITERKRVEEALDQARRQAERRAAELEAVLQAVPAAVWIAHDPECRNITGNRTAYQWLHLPQGAEASLTAAEGERPNHFSVRHKGRVIEGDELPVQQAARGIEVRDFEEEIVLSDGSVRPAFGHATPLRDDQGRPRGAVAAFIDITERKRVEAALRDSEQRLRLALDAAYAISFEWDIRRNEVRRHVSTTPALEATPEQATSTFEAVCEVVHPQDRWRFVADVQEAIEREDGRYESEFRVIDPDGKVVWLFERGRVERDDQGRPARLLGLSQDVTARRQAEHALYASEQRLAGIVGSAMDAIIAVDAEQRIRVFNAAAEEIFRLGAPQALGQPLAALIPERFREVHAGHVRHFAQSATTPRRMGTLGTLGTLWGLRADGEEFPCEASISQIEVAGDTVFTVILRDITARLTAEAELRDGRERLELALEAAQAGYWDWDLATGRASCAAECYAIWGVTPGTEDLAQWLQAVHPEDVGWVSAAWWQAGAAGGDLNLEYRIEHPQRGTRWLAVRGRALRDETGRAVRISGLSLDITERRQTLEALRKSQEQLRALVEQAPVSIAMCDRRMDYIAASRRWVADYGRGRADLVGVNHYDINPDLPEAWKRVHREALGGAFLKNDDDLWTQADGSRHWLRWAVQPWTDEAGAIGGIIMSGEDITDRKLAEAALRDSQADLNRAQAVGRIGSWRLDVRRNELTWSAENHRIFGIPQGTPLTYETFLATIHPDDRAYVDRKWQDGLRGEPYDVEHRLLVDGRVTWVRERAALEFDPDGNLLGGFGTTQDITELKAAEGRLRLQLNLTHAITTCAAGAIFVTDGEGCTSFANAEVERLFGFTRDELMGRVLHDCIHHHHPDGRPYPFADCPNCRIYGPGETVRDHEAVFFRKDGTPVTVMCANSALEVDGEQMGAVLVAHDITGLKHSEEALREADRRKDEFLATLAHELRNPLAPIRSAVEILKLKAPDDPTLQAVHGLIDRQLRHLVRLVDDLLDVSRITRGRLQLRRERVALAEVLEQALEASRPHVECAGHDLSVTLPPVPVYLDADPVRLAQVFLNLIHNACKYTNPGGQIRVSAELDGPEVVVTVADTGIGVPPEDLVRLFETFAQLGPTGERAQGGLGIGLSLARGLVEMHGGSIEARSEGPGKGTQLVVRLPTLPGGSAAQPAPAPAAAVQPAAARRVLVVDDHRDVVESLALLLRATGYQVEIAHDGLEAIEAAGRYRPDLVLLDIGMPKLDGYATCRRIREHPWGRDMTIVALTGWGQEDDQRRTREAGFDGHLVKPLDPRALFDLLSDPSAPKG